MKYFIIQLHLWLMIIGFIWIFFNGMLGLGFLILNGFLYEVAALDKDKEDENV